MKNLNDFSHLTIKQGISVCLCVFLSASEYLENPLTDRFKSSAGDPWACHVTFGLSLTRNILNTYTSAERWVWGFSEWGQETNNEISE